MDAGHMAGVAMGYFINNVFVVWVQPRIQQKFQVYENFPSCGFLYFGTTLNSRCVYLTREMGPTDS